ncbi:MAG TPA: type IV toxin-antitoxin system AbiEi family antitoxin domain-containing protein [Solirubrobacterales bacterium]
MARIAARQHGVIEVSQLHEVGVDKSAISRRVRSGRLHRVHQGVYAVGHRGLSLHGRFTAAVLACGQGAVLSHTSAAVLWELLYPIDGPVHVSVPSTSGRKNRRGIHLHRCPSLKPQAPAEPSPSPSSSPIRGGRGRRLLITHRDRIPVTTIPRTIEDLEGCVPPRLYRRARRQAELMGHRLEGVASDRTRSDLESLFLELCARHRIPPPEVNVKLGRREVDFLWRSRRVVVETDHWTYHRGSVAFEDDHARDLDLRAAGYTVLRFSDRQLEEEPERVMAVVRAALEDAGR